MLLEVGLGTTHTLPDVFMLVAGILTLKLVWSKTYQFVYTFLEKLAYSRTFVNLVWIFPLRQNLTFTSFFHSCTPHQFLGLLRAAQEGGGLYYLLLSLLHWTGCETSEHLMRDGPCKGSGALTNYLEISFGCSNSAFSSLSMYSKPPIKL